MIKLALKFTKSAIKISLIGKHLDEIEFFILDSIDKGFSFDEISESININKNNICKFFSYLEGKYFKNNNLTTEGKEILILNKFVKDFNNKNKKIFIDKYNEKIYYTENDVDTSVFKLDKKDYHPVKEKTYHYKTNLLFKDMINGKADEKINLIFKLSNNITDEEKIFLEKNKDFIFLNLILSERKDYFLLKSFNLPN